ncbi:hypothetical protein [Nonomuraea jabiensis]|uniref:hypothetical protein n=1 Tax=Nonomuraea jabiensis TaxID=882448 RepID=UPI003D7298CE
MTGRQFVDAAIAAQTDEQRAEAAAQGLLADATAFLDEMRLIAESGWPLALEAFHIASRLAWDWLMGARISDGDEEPPLRLAASRAIVASRGREHAAFNAWLTAVPILELPEGHPERDVAAAREILNLHLDTCRARQDATGRLWAIATLLRYALVPRAREEELLAEGASVRDAAGEYAREAFDQVTADPQARGPGQGRFVLGRPLPTRGQRERSARTAEARRLRGLTDRRLGGFIAAWRATRASGPLPARSDRPGSVPYGDEAAFLTGLGLGDEARRLDRARRPGQGAGDEGGGLADPPAPAEQGAAEGAGGLAGVPTLAERGVDDGAGGLAGVLALAEQVAAGDGPVDPVAVLREIGLDDDDLLGVCVFALCDPARQQDGTALTLLNVVGLASADPGLGARLLSAESRVLKAKGNLGGALYLLELAGERLDRDAGADDRPGRDGDTDGDGDADDRPGRDGDAELAARLLSQRAAIHGELNEFAEALALGRRSAALAGRADAVAAEADLTVAAALLALGRRMECADILATLGSRLTDPAALQVLGANQEALALYRESETAQFVAEVALPRFLADADEYVRRGDPEEGLALAREAHRQAAALPPAPVTMAAARAYGAALLHTGRPTQALSVTRDALERLASSASGPAAGRAELLALQGQALAALGDPAAAEVLTQARDQAIELADDDLRATAATALARAEAARGEPGRAAAAVEEAIDARMRTGGWPAPDEFGRWLDELDQAATPSRRGGAALRAALGAARVRWYAVGGTQEHFNHGIEQLRAAHAGTGLDGPRRDSVAVLAAALLEEFERLGDPALLDEAMAAVEAAPDASPSVTIAHAAILRVRYARLRVKQDLDHAIDLLLSLGANPGPAAWLELGHLLRERYARDGLLTDLDQAIDLYERAATGQADRTALLPHVTFTALGNGWRDRYLRTRLRTDIDRSIGNHRSAESLVRDGTREQASVRVNLATALRERYRLLLADPHVRAVLAASRAARAFQETSGGVIIASFDPPATRDAALLVEDMNAAVNALESALEHFAEGSPHRAAVLTTLGICHLDRFELDGSRHDLIRAVSLTQQALRTLAPGSPRRALHLNNAANCLAIVSEPGSLAAAFETYRDACRAGLESAPHMSLLAAGNWERSASRAGDWRAAAESSTYALRALEQLFRAQLTRPHKETWLAEAQGLPARAARAHALAGDPRGAVVAFESGRALLHSEMLDLLRADLDDLSTGHPDLATRYLAAAERWRGFLQPPGAGSPQAHIAPARKQLP